MIKIFLNNGSARWEKDNKSYGCFREFNGKTTIYSLYVRNTTTYKTNPRIRSESLANINEWLKNSEVEIVED